MPIVPTIFPPLHIIKVMPHHGSSVSDGADMEGPFVSLGVDPLFGMRLCRHVLACRWNVGRHGCGGGRQCSHLGNLSRTLQVQGTAPMASIDRKNTHTWRDNFLKKTELLESLPTSHDKYFSCVRCYGCVQGLRACSSVRRVRGGGPPYQTADRRAVPRPGPRKVVCIYTRILLFSRKAGE